MAILVEYAIDGAGRGIRGHGAHYWKRKIIVERH
jgi:hypothetical protein